MAEDPTALILGGVVGSGSLLLAWAIVQLGQAITALTRIFSDGVKITVIKTAGGEKDERG